MDWPDPNTVCAVHGGSSYQAQLKHESAFFDYQLAENGIESGWRGRPLLEYATVQKVAIFAGASKYSPTANQFQRLPSVDVDLEALRVHASTVGFKTGNIWIEKNWQSKAQAEKRWKHRCLALRDMQPKPDVVWLHWSGHMVCESDSKLIMVPCEGLPGFPVQAALDTLCGALSAPATVIVTLDGCRDRSGPGPLDSSMPPLERPLGKSKCDHIELVTIYACSDSRSASSAPNGRGRLTDALLKHINCDVSLYAMFELVSRDLRGQTPWITTCCKHLSGSANPLSSLTSERCSLVKRIETCKSERNELHRREERLNSQHREIFQKISDATQHAIQLSTESDNNTRNAQELYRECHSRLHESDAKYDEINKKLAALRESSSNRSKLLRVAAVLVYVVGYKLYAMFPCGDDDDDCMLFRSVIAVLLCLLASCGSWLVETYLERCQQVLAEQEQVVLRRRRDDQTPIKVDLRSAKKVVQDGFDSCRKKVYCFETVRKLFKDMEPIVQAKASLQEELCANIRSESDLRRELVHLLEERLRWVPRLLPPRPSKRRQLSTEWQLAAEVNARERLHDERRALEEELQRCKDHTHDIAEKNRVFQLKEARMQRQIEELAAVYMKHVEDAEHRNRHLTDKVGSMVQSSRFRSVVEDTPVLGESTVPFSNGQPDLQADLQRRPRRPRRPRDIMIFSISIALILILTTYPHWSHASRGAIAITIPAALLVLLLSVSLALEAHQRKASDFDAQVCAAAQSYESQDEQPPSPSSEAPCAAQVAAQVQHDLDQLSRAHAENLSLNVALKSVRDELQSSGQQAEDLKKELRLARYRLQSSEQEVDGLKEALELARGELQTSEQQVEGLCRKIAALLVEELRGTKFIWLDYDESGRPTRTPMYVRCEPTGTRMPRAFRRQAPSTHPLFNQDD